MIKSTLRIKTLVIVLLSISYYQSFGQSIVENQVDEFTNQSIIRSSWEPLSKTMNGSIHFRISKINSFYFLELKMILGQGGSVFAIDEDNQLMFKLSSGDIVTLHNKTYTITCEGCGAVGFVGSTAQGIQVTYPLNDDQVKTLKSSSIEKMRVYRTKDYIEETLKSKYSNNVVNALKLF